jgi:RimJ/RimL family protein N-acetyltransferase
VQVRLRDVEPGDLDAYVRMRCDPAMMAELGGPQPAEHMPGKVARDVAAVRDGSTWIKMIEVEGVVAGIVTLWSHDDSAEIGWMVLTEFQGQGLAKRAVRELLELARQDGRWGVVHAYPGVTNGPSNGLCRSLGFTLVGPVEIDFNNRRLRSNDWIIDT